jgi:hypothetical protein
MSFSGKVVVDSANTFFPLFPAFFDTLSVYSGDTGSVSVYRQRLL